MLTSTEFGLSTRSTTNIPYQEQQAIVIVLEELDPEEAPYAKAIGFPMCITSLAALGLVVASDASTLGSQLRKAAHTIYKFLPCSRRDKARKKKENPLVI